jgi:hypothetical protein
MGADVSEELTSFIFTMEEMNADSEELDASILRVEVTFLH